MKKTITAVIAILLLWSAPVFAKYVMDGPLDGVKFYVTRYGIQFRALADGSITIGKTGSYVMSSFPMYHHQYKLDSSQQIAFVALLKKYIEWYEINMEKKLVFVKEIGTVGPAKFIYLNNYGKNELKIDFYESGADMSEWLDYKTAKQICVALKQDNLRRYVLQAKQEEQKKRDAEQASSRMKREADAIFK